MNGLEKLLQEIENTKIYFFKEGEENNPPTNWESKFGGKSWEYVPELKMFYLHLFDKTQADLNWENPEVKKEIYKIIDFWISKGVEGFRFDVINLISKPEKNLKTIMRETEENFILTDQKYMNI